MPVLAETQGGWDSVYTCNPKVIRGTFANPLGNGESFTYAMYYVGTGSLTGFDNSIGVAFSNDGISWKKYPHPIISPETQEGYGLGQPAVYNNDHHAAIRMFYEDDSVYPRHVEAISSDGVHFVTLGTLTTNGLDPNARPGVTWPMTRRTDIGTPASIPLSAIHRPQGEWWSGVSTASSYTGSLMHPF